MKKKTPQKNKKAVSVKQSKKASKPSESLKKGKVAADPSPKKQASKLAVQSKGKLENAAKKEEKVSKSDKTVSKKASVLSNEKEALKGKTAAKKKGKREESEDIAPDEDFLLDDAGDNAEIAEYEEELSEFESDEEEVETEEVIVETEVSITKESSDDDVVLLDAEGRRYCRARDCDQAAVVDGYCRFHYLLLWKKIQIRRKILADGKLERYVDELTARYPDKFLEVIRKDLRSEKDFMSAIRELEIDESQSDNDYEEDTQLIDEVRGMGDSVGSSGADVEDDF